MSDERKRVFTIQAQRIPREEKPKPKRRAPVRRKKSTSPNTKKLEEATAEKAAPEVASVADQKPEKSEPEQKTEESNPKPQPQPKSSAKRQKRKR